MSKGLWASCLVAVSACGQGKHGQPANVPAIDALAPAAEVAASNQIPPVGEAALRPWLASGAYKAWNCESAPHAQRSPSPHGLNRICSNNLAAKAGLGEYPVGAAAVKEIYKDDQVVSYAVAQHVSAGQTGDSWYWYAQIKGSAKVDGLGDSNPAKGACVACHSAAGSDSDHSGHDLVYTQVKASI